ncbi:MAG: TraR/DksA C4-type zinc finger protein [Thermoguttaceae bacterium]
MNATLSQRYKARLLEMRTRLVPAVQHIEESIREDVRSAGELSNAPTHQASEDDEGVDENIALAENQETLLEEVEAALARIADGDYGRCQQCGRAISAERLGALPSTPYCVQCAPKE